MTPEQISAYLARHVAEGRYEEFERHLLVCAACRNDLADASDLEARTPRRWLTVGAPAAAAAALLLLVLGPVATRQPTSPVLRDTPGPGLERLTTLTPAIGARVSANALVFQWRSYGTGTYYEFTLTDAEGDVVFDRGTSDTVLVLPRSVGLQPDATYFWYVDALLTGTRSVTSGVKDFAVTP